MENQLNISFCMIKFVFVQNILKFLLYIIEQHDLHASNILWSTFVKNFQDQIVVCCHFWRIIPTQYVRPILYFWIRTKEAQTNIRANKTYEPHLPIWSILKNKIGCHKQKDNKKYRFEGFWLQKRLNTQIDR